MYFVSVLTLIKILRSQYYKDLFIGGYVSASHVVLFRGNFKLIKVPRYWFKQSGTKLAPNFKDFKIIDYGQTIMLGYYEVASDAVLYEFDNASKMRMDLRRKAK